ncbi:hypothetical protein QMT40_001825 [Parvibaculaceae bacterium PLY_AMNH_Bact1]|nr:hypothetical protein QMT40_001825 [Parvibaculaceae bacterium PLY_AMNH_Bact1]
MDPLLEKITKTIFDHFSGRFEVTPDTYWQDILEDSLDTLELCLELNIATDLEVDDEDIENATTVHDLFLTLKEKVPA